MSRKLVIDDGRARRELLLVGTMIVGRDPECEISSGDPRLSRRHAEFSVTSSGIVVRDLQSRNGVRVNGATIKEATLAPGDVVEVAHLSLRFVDESEAATAATPVAAAGVPVSVAAPVEDDRTRAVAAGALASAAAAHTMPMPAFVPDRGDDRTRVLPNRGAGVPRGSASPPTAPITSLPLDPGEIVIREPAVSPRAVGTRHDDLGVQALASLRWGRRVLAQGVLLALVVFLMTAIPILAWQSRMFGASALRAWTVLLPPLGASAFAGVVVAGLIARTAVRGRERDAGR